MTTPSEADRILAGRQSDIGTGIEALIESLNRASDDYVRRNVVRQLPDRELLTAAVWIEHTDVPESGDSRGVRAIADECRERAQRARTFAAYLEDPTASEVLRRLLDHP